MTLVGIRNPDTDETLTYTMAVMNFYDKNDDTRNTKSEQYYKNSMLYFTTKTNKFFDAPSAYLDLISVETNVPAERKLSGTDTYRLTFQT